MRSQTKLKSLFEEKKSFVLVCHVEPDGDAIGSMMGLGRALFTSGKEVTLVCKDAIPETFKFLDPENIIQNDLPEQLFDVLVLLDNGDARRTGMADQVKRLRKDGVTIVNIDHHQKNDLWKLADINFVDENTSSTSEIVLNFLEHAGYEITEPIATALLAGIYNDTGGFRHSNTDDKVLSLVSELLAKGARLKKVSDSIENRHSFAKFKLWGIALDRLRLNSIYGLAISILTQNDLKKCDASEDDISGLISLLNSIPEARAVLLLYESGNDKIRGSFRTEKDDIDLSKLARLFGGGGHKKASGFAINGRIKIEGEEWKIG